MSNHSFARAWRTVAGLAPEREAVVCGARRLTFGELDERASRLSRAFSAGGLEPGDKVAIMLVNSPEYVETFYAAQLLGAVPVNVNYRYVGAELAYLLDNSDAAALVFHDEFAPTVRDALATLPAERHPRMLLEVSHAGGDGAVAGAGEYEAALSAAPDGQFAGEREPSGNDLIFIYTGGTTGSPKAVMWRSDDLYVSLWQLARPGTLPPDPADAIEQGKRAATALPACPLMHGTGLFITLTTLAGGGTVVLIDSPRLDADAVWSAVERERVHVLSIVGDAFARPLLAALDAQPKRHDLSSLTALTSSGVTFSPEAKRGFLSHLDGVMLIDSLGATEGIMTRSEVRGEADIRPARFKCSDRVVVVTDDDELAQPGDGRIGLLAVGGPIPLGYYKDDAKTAATFRMVAGRRYSIPGDYAIVEADGTITLLGRGSACINTGGEKVYPEEVELTLHAHPAVFDCVVLGVPDERWGEMVVAVVQPRDGNAPSEADLASHCRGSLARYKVPKRFLLVDSLQRAPSGKADYGLLRGLAAERLA